MSTVVVPADFAGLPGIVGARASANSLRIDLDPLDPAALADLARRHHLRLGAVTGTPLAAEGETEVVYHFIDFDRLVDFATVSRGRALPSLAPHLKPAVWAEREIHDLFGVDFPGHPDLAPLMRPEGFVVGMMREPMCIARRMPTPDPAPELSE
jgi:NADH-quinone oxidoreductase subunit C